MSVQCLLGQCPVYVCTLSTASLSLDVCLQTHTHLPTVQFPWSVASDLNDKQGQVTSQVKHREHNMTKRLHHTWLTCSPQRAATWTVQAPAGQHLRRQG